VAGCHFLQYFFYGIQEAIQFFQALIENLPEKTERFTGGLPFFLL